MVCIEPQLRTAVRPLVTVSDLSYPLEEFRIIADKKISQILRDREPISFAGFGPH